MPDHSSPAESGWWYGAVLARAERWADAVYARTKGAQPWPEGGVVMVHARKAIADVLSLSELGDTMVRTAYDLAKARYEKRVSESVR